jgi:hypothetical protein
MPGAFRDDALAEIDGEPTRVVEQFAFVGNDHAIIAEAIDFIL